jgi:uncharacterized protein with NRDE domain
MCTVLLLTRPGTAWPLLLGSNRDERLDRAFDVPAAWWPDEPGIVAWRDRLSGGSWLGINAHGVLATVVNRLDTLGPLPGKASRGELVLRALRKRDAASAAAVLGVLHGDAYGGFTLLLADRDGAYSVTNAGDGIEVARLPPGHHMLTPEGCDVATAPRVASVMADFRTAASPDPARDDWSGWLPLLQREDADDPHRAVTVTTDRGFGTVACTLVAVPEAGAPVLRYAAGPPTTAPFHTLTVPGFDAPASKAPS